MADSKKVAFLVGDASVDDFAALVLPGGVANPGVLPAFNEALLKAIG